MTVFLPDRLTRNAYLISIALHILLITILPGLGELSPSVKPRWIEIDLVSDLDTDRLDALSAEGGIREIADSADEMPSGDSPLFPAPPVDLPSRLNSFDLPPPANTFVSLPGALMPDIAGTSSTVTGIPSGSLIDPNELKIKPAGTPPDIPWDPSQAYLKPGVQIDQPDFPIEGPVSKRKVVYRPPLPHPVVSSSGNVQLKFWVYSDGTVGQIIPLVKADPELEKSAIEFLEKWRFEALPEGSPDQWGILPLRFKLN
ncbi:energy transducer TonB [bacterium]|nr:energy transducer TonB [candidate division CSSED10-310 bacterium]